MLQRSAEADRNTIMAGKLTPLTACSSLVGWGYFQLQGLADKTPANCWEFVSSL